MLSMLTSVMTSFFVEEDFSVLVSFVDFTCPFAEAIVTSWQEVVGIMKICSNFEYLFLY